MWKADTVVVIAVNSSDIFRDGESPDCMMLPVYMRRIAMNRLKLMGKN